MTKRTRRRQWSIIALLALVATVGTLYFTYNQNQIYIQSTQASIDYGISTNSQTRFYNYSEDTVNAWCNNGGGMDGSFSLAITFTNATVSSPQSYKVNNTLVIFPFLLHKSGASGDSNNQNVAFTIDNNVSGFSISISLEKRDQNPLKANPFQYQFIQCNWNSQDNCFEIVD